MDGALNSGDRADTDRCLPHGEDGMPMESEGRMPEQELSSFDRARRRGRTRRGGDGAAWAGRCFMMAGTAALAGFATNELRLALAVGGLTVLEILVLALFAIDVTWIALAFVTSLAGCARLLVRRRRPQRIAQAPLQGRTALVLPTYNEDPARIASALDAMGRSLFVLGEAHAFDLFILSDTRDGSIALAEEEVFWALRERLGGGPAVYYRRRLHNTAHKSGNIREFCERWGRRYEYLLILDADSLLDGAAISRLAHRIESDPDAGLVQTVPVLHNATTLLARVQQFATRVYGPPLAAGLAWWTGREGNFWGHNAIVRMAAFMDSAGLPELPGDPPFGGPILSHDFVEAALLRRAGWSVIIADDLDGSYEECPASMADMETRDRRWCQGNLQHTRVIGAKGLHFISRLHMMNGIFSYLSSPVWLLFLVLALGLGIQNEFAKPEYFTRAYTLFPLWPHIDPVRALRLLGITMAILLGPKLLGVIAFVLRDKTMRLRDRLIFPLSLAVELIVSALVAPVLMLVHCGLVFSVLLGRDSGWRPQRRADFGLPWSQVVRRHRWHMLAGIVLSLAALSISWEMLAWLLPAVIGMVLAAPLALLTASPSVGRGVRSLALLRVPEEVKPTAICASMFSALPFYRAVVARTPDMLSVACSPELLRRHLRLTDHAAERVGDTIDTSEGTALLKIQRAAGLDEGVGLLTPREQACVLSLPSLLLALSRLPRRT